MCDASGSRTDERVGTFGMGLGDPMEASVKKR
jgi:hypothetical protein